MTQCEHHRHDGPEERNRYLWLACLAFLNSIVELLVGFRSGSLTLIADGVHGFSDGLNSLWSAFIAQRVRMVSSEERLRRIGFTISLMLIGLPAVFTAIEAFERIIGTGTPLPPWTLYAALFSLAINALMWRIHESAPDHDRNLTHWSERIHILQDMGASMAAVLGILLTVYFEIQAADAWTSFVIVVFILGRLGQAAYEVFIKKKKATAQWTHRH